MVDIFGIVFGILNYLAVVKGKVNIIFEVVYIIGGGGSCMILLSLSVCMCVDGVSYN